MRDFDPRLFFQHVFRDKPEFRLSSGTDFAGASQVDAVTDEELAVERMWRI